MAGFQYDAGIDFNELTVNKTDIENILPYWKTRINEIHQFKSNDNIEIDFNVAAKTATEVGQWLRDYEEKSKCSYTIRSSEKCSGLRVKLKQRLKCHHNTRCTSEYDPSPGNRTRNSKCPSIIVVTLRALHKRYKGKNKAKAPDPEMPCEIKLIPYHNHSTSSVDALRYRRVKNETKQKVIDLFETGHSPVTALESIKMDIQMKYENFHEILVDRSLCPDYMYCYHLYAKIFKQEYGPLQASHEFLEKKIEQFNLDTKSESAKIKFIDEDYVICLCPPLMQRVHKTVEEASEVVFMDSTGTADHDGNRIFILLTTSDCGGLPLAIILISSSECTNLISVGFQLLKEIMGDRIFHGAINGPTLFMTVDSAAEQAAIQSEWPNSTIRLCLIHVLKSIWRWLMKTKNGIKQVHQNKFFQEFRKIMYANNEEECLSAYLAALTSSEQYPEYQIYLNKYWGQRELWASCYRNCSSQRLNITCNISEVAMCLLKETIFERIKAFNLIQVIDFMMTRFVSYYEERLLDAAHNRTRRNILHRLIRLPPSADIIEDIQHLTDNDYLVPCEKDSSLLYSVNTEVLTCACNQGKTGQMCKHISWVCCFVDSDKFIQKIDNEITRRKYVFIATGKLIRGSSTSGPFSSNINEEIISTNNYSENNEKFIEKINNMKTRSEYVIIATGSTNEPFSSEGNEEIISTNNCSENIDQFIDEPFIDEPSLDIKAEAVINEGQHCISKGSESINVVTEIFSEYLKCSPVEVSKALKVFVGKLRDIKTVSGFATACHTFGSGTINRRNTLRSRIPVQPTALSRRKTCLSRKTSRVGGNRRKSESRNQNVEIKKLAFPKME